MDRPRDPAAIAAAQDRAARLAEQLRANLRKRKAQARDAASPAPDADAEG